MSSETAVLLKRIEELETCLGLHDQNLGVVFKLPRSLAKLLGLLLSTPNVTPEMIQDRLRIATNAKVAVHRLRAGLAAWDVEINSKRSLGYWIDSETKARIRGIITPQGNSEGVEHGVLADA
jgi:hypothetical protein